MLFVIGGAVVLGLFVFSLFLAFIWRRVVETDMVHIVQSTKKTIDYGRGRPAGNSYYEFPAFLPFLGVTVTKFPLSIFMINLKEYEAYDINRVPFLVDVAAAFKIKDVQVAAQSVANMDELKNQLAEVLRGAVRRILANNKLENTMQDRSVLSEEFTKEVNDQLTEYGVTTAKIIEFMKISDASGSEVIFNIMAKDQSRIEKESREVVAMNKKEAETKEIEALREIDLSRAEAEQTVGIRIAEKDKLVGIAQERTNQEIQVEARTTAEREMEVRKVQEVRASEIAKDVAVVKAEEQQKVQVISAQAAKEAQIISANAEKESKILVAEGDLQSTLKDSEGTLALGTAEAEAERLKLHAPVSAQLTLAKEIGDNEGYQKYLIEVRKVEATEVVGKEMASAMKEADLKVIANSGNVQNGVASLGDIFTPAGGTSIAGMLEALAQTEQGKAVIDKFVKKAD